ncbi:MAG: filamentous hemagglutinin N-terminal domain-containing protein [Cyanobacteria bacterium P01_F01_bin.86]
MIASPAWAQTLEIDNTTPTQVNGSNECSGNCTVTGGAIAGDNLFHSFRHFGVDTNAMVTFKDPGVQNIITRVTGSGTSVIDGLLRVAGGNANLFLFNPNGITFGDGASLQLGGSFIASTANGVQFEDGAFTLTDNSATNSLLAVNVPLGLQVGSNAGDITVNGMGNNLFINPNLSVVDFLSIPDLAVKPNQTLALVGGNVVLDGAILAAPSGRVEIGGLSSGFVGLTPVPDGFRLDYDSIDSFADVTLQNAAAVNVNGSSAGSVQLQGQQISLSEGSVVLANTSGNGRGGLVQVNAESLGLTGASSFVPSFIPSEVASFVVMPSGIFASVGADASGSGSQIDINVNQLTLEAGAQIAASTFGSGDAGTLTVTAERLTAAGGRPFGPSGLFTTVAPGPDGGPMGASTGNGGNLTIATEVLSLRNGGQISAGTFGFGAAGNLTVRANQIDVLGSFGTPGAGGPSSLRSASERPWAGFGGTITVETNRLLVADGGQVVTGTLSPSPAGDLVVRASEQIDLRGGDAFGRSGLFASALLGPGSGGNITVETGELNLQDGATINVSNEPSTPGSTLPSGAGPAGNLAVTAQNIVLDNDSSFTSNTVDGDRANITVNATTLTLQDSRITTNATGTATGGNIDLEAEAITLLETSTISANAEFSFGGQVVITTDVLLQSPESGITATSALGTEFSGVVEINTPDTPPYQEQQQQENPTETKQIVAACEQLTENELVITGRGGLPTDPTQILTGQSVWADIREVGSSDSAISGVPATTASEITSPVTLNIAQGLERNEHGQLVLVAHSTTANHLVSTLRHQTSLCDRG